MANLYLGLVHHPIKNKRDQVVTTSVTNLDIHDIARSCRTFGVERYFIITPLEKQHELINRILGHWETDTANDYNPDRQDALSGVQVSNSFELTVAEIEKKEGVRPLVVVTGANFETDDGGVDELKKKWELDARPILLLFGTGWGLHASLTACADFFLEPLRGAAQDGYNHLSVRSAVAIYLDRIMGSSL